MHNCVVWSSDLSSEELISLLEKDVSSLLSRTSLDRLSLSLDQQAGYVPIPHYTYLPFSHHRCLPLLSSPLLVPLVTCSLALAGLPPPPCAVLTHPQMMKSRKCSSSSASTSWGKRTSTRRSRISQTRSCLRYAMLCYGGVYHVVCPRMWCMRYDIVHGVHRCCKEKEESNQI